LCIKKPFGESKANEDVDKDGNTFTLNLRFPGQYFDKETKKHYNINRDYDLITGRYIQSDPIGFDGGVNTYLYVGGNPIVRVDESGNNYGTVVGAEYGSWFGPWGAAAGAVVGTAIVYFAGKAIVNEISKEKNKENKVALYRVVEKIEYDDLMKTHEFRVPLGHIGEKQFWFQSIDADWYSKNMFGKPYALIKIYVSKSILEKGYMFEDVGHRAISFNEAVLPLLNIEMNINGGIYVIKKY